jgi:hypothetical protein
MGSVLLEDLGRHEQAFLKSSALLHGGKFDYSLVEYIISIVVLLFLFARSRS